MTQKREAPATAGTATRAQEAALSESDNKFSTRADACKGLETKHWGPTRAEVDAAFAAIELGAAARARVQEGLAARLEQAEIDRLVAMFEADRARDYAARLLEDQARLVPALNAAAAELAWANSELGKVKAEWAATGAEAVKVAPLRAALGRMIAAVETTRAELDRTRTALRRARCARDAAEDELYAARRGPRTCKS